MRKVRKAVAVAVDTVVDVDRITGGIEVSTITVELMPGVAVSSKVAAAGAQADRKNKSVSSDVFLIIGLRHTKRGCGCSLDEVQCIVGIAVFGLDLQRLVPGGDRAIYIIFAVQSPALPQPCLLRPIIVR